MPDRILLIDQGNTRIKWVMASDGEVDPTSAGRGDLDEFARAFQADAPGPDAVIISSVADPEPIEEVSKFCRTRWNLEIRLLRSRREQGGIHNAYSDPGALGVDRWLAIVGAVKHYGKPLVIWDLGTATTLDAVNENGQHLGGFIYPGPATMLESLRRDTKLRVPDKLDAGAAGAVDAALPGVSPGESTEDCISRGVLAAQLGALNQFLRNISARIDTHPELVVTGGAAEQILPLLNLDYTHDPWLVFRGMLVD